MAEQKLYPGTQVISAYEEVDFGSSRSGLYETSKKEVNWKLDLKIDVDVPRPFTKALNFVSGTLTQKGRSKAPWTGSASAAFFRCNKQGVTFRGGSVDADVFVMLSDGGRRQGQIKVALKESRGQVSCDVTIMIESGSVTFKDVERTSQFFRDVTIDIDFVDKLIWPVIELKNYRGTTASMTTRKMDLFSVFEDAGLKLNHEKEDSQKVEDPTPDTPWSMADMYDVMEDYFDQAKETDENIWCLLAIKPPDSRYMGFSFDQEGKYGFGLFSGHSSFNGIESDDEKIKANSLRRFLHYMAHECGHCLGLSHPFEQGESNSLSWMNYAWKYDSINSPGKFYERFRYSFSDDELNILRHQPDKAFKVTYERESGTAFEYSSRPKTEAPDSMDEEDEDSVGGNKSGTTPTRKLIFSIKFRSKPFAKGDVVEFEATIRNIGKLPCKIEPGLTPGGGNLTVYVTDPVGEVQIAKSFVSGIDSPNRRYVTLGRAGSSENSDVYSEVVPLIQSSRGPIFKSVGTYRIKAVYEGAGFKLTSQPATVGIEVDDDDEDMKTQVRVAATLDGSASESRSKVIDYWKTLAAKATEEKVPRLQTIVRLLLGLSKGGLKVLKAKRASKRRRRSRRIERAAALRSASELISDTDDLVQYCKENYDGDAVDDYHYSKLVLARGSICCGIGKFSQADAEYNQMIADMVYRSTDFDFVKRISSEWQKIRYPKREWTKEESDASYQQRVEQLIYWTPKDIADEADQSGIGLDRPFNSFDDDHLRRASVFADYLAMVEEDTDDLDAVLDYAEGKLKSQDVNHQAYQFALETYVVHSKLAKKHGVRYPDPPKRDGSMTSTAAIFETKREGHPKEPWMNYWRCDADFNYHHRHWHAVYRGGRFGDRKRQGELFGYMHSQMLARYDADRESWGLPPVKAYEYDETEPDGFDAGWEFHEAPDFRFYARRPAKQIWNVDMQKWLMECEENLINCFDQGEFDHGGKKIKLNTDLAGHIVEATSGEFNYKFGSLHNQGHMAFCSTNGIPARHTTYMGSSLTAVRDPIFFRWHKRVDNLYQYWNDKVKQELGEGAPGVIITPTDALIHSGTDVPTGFDEWGENGWKYNNYTCPQINTYLKEAELKYEWDNKLDHEPFSYHIRIRRKPATTGELALTLRLFICQTIHVNDRRRWIEMDKFVYRMGADQDHAVIRRLDRESSVIKRLHADAENSEESSFVRTVPGNCDCGWPFRMLLPRGLKGGEHWVFGVFISDNSEDNIDMCASCGSMSYCGTRNTPYPDSRTMGYPFSSKICIDKKIVSITKAAELLSNFCITPFEIVNDFEILNPPVDIPEKAKQPITVWAPDSILNTPGVGDYRKSRLTGRFRVVLDDADFRKMGASRIRIRFKGRMDSMYAISDVKIALRRANTLDVDQRCNVAVTFKGLAEADVPEDGLTSDEVVLPVATSQENDYFVTFTIKSPSCYIYVPKSNRFNTILVASANAAEATKNDNWENERVVIKKRFRSLYAIECILLA